MRAMTDANPSSKPAPAAATIVQREPRARRDTGASASGSRTLATTAASLGGGSDSTTGGTEATGGRLGVGIARSVIFSLALGGGGTLDAGAAGRKLERATGMSSHVGASPPRTTTAWRGGVFRPGRAMKPPRGVSASSDAGGAESSSSGEWLLIGRLAFAFAVTLRRWQERWQICPHHLANRAAIVYAPAHRQASAATAGSV